MQSQTTPPVLPVAPIAFIIGGRPNVSTQIGPFVFPHSIATAQPVYFPSPVPVDELFREAKEKCKEKLRLKEHIEQPVPSAPVLKPTKRGRKLKYPFSQNDENDQKQNKTEPPAPPSSPKSSKKLIVNLVPISMHSWQLPNGEKIRQYQARPSLP